VTLGSTDLNGKLDSPMQVDAETRFDFASLTKLFTTTAFFRLAEAGIVGLDTPVAKVLPVFTGERPIRPYPHPLNTGEQVHVVEPTDQVFDVGAITFRQLLTHSSGLPAWLNLREPATYSDRLASCLNTPLSYPPGSQVVYSDVGYILLGVAIQKLYGAGLREAMTGLVLTPMGFDATYGLIQENVAPTEFCQWRKRRIVGEVHDENAATLDGVAGHAGLFGTVTDIASLGQLYLEGGQGLLSKETTTAATTRQIEDRGLGWMMRSLTGPTSSGQFFSPESYGHTGFVGNSLWIDPERQLVCAVLTNNVFYGREKSGIIEFRKSFHDRVIQALW
jgi:CubicO group peptidase (beta-lactamase class C family)